MNLRRHLYLNYATFRGNRYPRYLREFIDQDLAGIAPGTTRGLLVNLLLHCRRSVPYYSGLIETALIEAGANRDGRNGAEHHHGAEGSSELETDPERFLTRLPILTKDLIRANFEGMKSTDLEQRAWYMNASGGSTGEPIRLVQDSEYRDKTTALTLLYSHLIGRDMGESEIRLWGSDKELFQGTLGWKANFLNFLSNTTYLNAFRMTPERMREFIGVLNKSRPKLLVAYAQALYELARFADQERIEVVPQRAILTSAGTLYPFMRKQIESTFRCQVFNRYGSREVSDVACERPGVAGLWVAPWGAYVEIVDEHGRRVPAGVEGNILITSLTNYAMPILRYQIGDRGVLATEGLNGTAQVLEQVTGRISDNFRTQGGKFIPGEYFIHMVGVVLNRGNIKRFQIVQKRFDQLVLRVATHEGSTGPFDSAEIIDKIKAVMDGPCSVQVELVDDIPPTPSGKYRFTISEIS